jgi:hypothetical protein
MDYESYYLSQARNQVGSGLIQIYRGRGNQRGYGWIGRNFARYSHYLLPASKYIGKKIWDVGYKVLQDKGKGGDLKTSLKKHISETTGEIGRDMVEHANKKMQGGGRKRKYKKRPNKKTSYRKRKTLKSKGSKKTNKSKKREVYRDIYA